MSAPLFRGPLLALLSSALIASCQPVPRESAAPAPAPSDWPGFDYADAARRGGAVFRIEPQQSRVEVVVRRAGALARLGHDHVIAVAGLEGFLLMGDGADAGRGDLRFPVALLQIDEAAARQRYALDTEPGPDAIEGTRRNLLDHVLEADAWPWIGLRLAEIRAQGDHYSAAVTVTVKASEFTDDWTFELEANGDIAAVSGQLQVLQSELGLEPFTALGGGLRVADAMEIHFRLQGSRLRDP